MEVAEEKKGNINIFKISGRLDSKTSRNFEEVIVKASKRGINKMIFDFKELEYISSAGLNVILKTTRRLKQENGNLVVCSLQDYIKEIFEIAGFDTLFPIMPDLNKALNKF